MGVKTLLKWSKQITPSKVEQLLRAERDLRKAKIIFDSASAEYSNGFRHDHTTFGVMISKLVSANEFRPAEEMLNRMKEEKCRVTEEIFLSICRGYGRVHLPLDAIRVFHKMNDFGCKPTDKSYISVFAILVEENQLKVAMSFYKMKLQGLKPDAGLYGKVINGFCNIRKFQEAATYLDEMILGQISPNRVTWSLHVKLNNTVVQGLCTNGNLNRAFQLYLGMRTRGISIDAGTFDSLVKCFCKRGDLHKSVRIFDEMVLDGCVPDHGIWSAVVGGFWDRRKVREAFELIVVELMNEFVEHE
ncbi:PENTATRICOPEPTIDE REPEAT-CONTAINING PROTEIN 1 MITOCHONDRIAL [Salix viminalis]|uniref:PENTATRICOPEPTIDE REPEAT-CONTAINING PROTEIN 1 MITOCHONDRIAL n=1 Tax=Salix viminalis TaxID=40686 RepID=A0A9Q0Z825_SALVM|nr:PENTATRICOPEPTIDE REPEAT-CONTAINING PROTEIN 1 MITOCHONDRIAL [Salix viminalis]